MTSPFARLLIRAAGLLVPRGRRAEWREEWLGELAALEYDHNIPPALSGGVRRGNYMFGWINWKRDYLDGDSGVYGASTSDISPVESCIQPLSSSPIVIGTPRRMMSCRPSYQRMTMLVSLSSGDSCT